MNARHVLIIAALTLGVWGAARAEEKKPAAPAYPLDTCVVSGEKLGSMGENYELEHNGQKVVLCCKSCLKKFNKDPEKYLAKLAAAQEEKSGKNKAKPADGAHQHHNVHPKAVEGQGSSGGKATDAAHQHHVVHPK